MNATSVLFPGHEMQAPPDYEMDLSHMHLRIATILVRNTFEQQCDASR